MATNNAPANPLMTTEITATPLAPVAAPTTQAGELVSSPVGEPVVQPQAAAPVAPASAPSAGMNPAPETVVDRGDADIPNETRQQATGVGTDGETNVWEARYSMKNFLGRLTFWGIATAAWIALAIYVWPYNHDNLAILAIFAGIAVLGAWFILARRILLARFGHYYRLTNRRLFVSTGLFNRRRDQMELLRVQDVYTRQSLFQRGLGVGTVVVVSSEPHFPILYLTGVDDPKYVMDLVWHHARAERDRRSVKVDQI